MLGILQTIFLAVAVVIGIVMIVAATRPRNGRIERSVDIKAQPERIFPHIDNLQAMNVWNPFVKTDPNLKGTYSGPPQGVGSAFTFDGNKNAGAGHITIKESVPHSLVRLNLVMTRPFACDNIVEFSLVPRGDSTRVSWAVMGPSPYWMRVFGLLIGMEKMMKRTLDGGLAGLKAIAER